MAIFILNIKINERLEAGSRKAPEGLLSGLATSRRFLFFGGAL